jgi:hypothetical protein
MFLFLKNISRVLDGIRYQEVTKKALEENRFAKVQACSDEQQGSSQPARK